MCYDEWNKRRMGGVEMGKIIGVAINKGGNGKTSLTTNLAGVIGKKLGKKVLIVNVDGQGNAEMTFGLNPNEIENTIYDVIMGDLEPKDVIIKLDNNVSILPANQDMDFLDFDVLTNIKRYPKPFKLLEEALKGLADDYDYIFIDSPPAMGLIAGNVLAMADEILIPFVPEPYSIRGLVRMLQTIDSFKNNHNPDLKVTGVVGMMVEGRTNLHAEKVLEAKEYCATKGIRFFDTVIPKSISFANSVAYEGQPATWGKNNPLVSSYTRLMDEFINIK